MSYKNLSDEEAMAKIEEEYDLDRHQRNSIMEPDRVLYFLDAFGDLELAITCHPLPFYLPDEIYKSIKEYDVLTDWGGAILEHECGGCGRDLYEFDWHTCSLIFDEYGNEHSGEIQHLTDPAGYVWDATGDHHFLCALCQYDGNFSRLGEEWGVHTFYGEHDEFYTFRTANGLVSNDSMSSDRRNESPRNIRDKDGNLVRNIEIETAFAKGGSDLNELMKRLGFIQLGPNDVRVETGGLKSERHYASEILSDWATAIYDHTTDDTHPDLDFTYIIRDGKDVFVRYDHVHKFLHELEDQVLFRAGEQSALKKHRGREVEA